MTFMIAAWPRPAAGYQDRRRLTARGESLASHRDRRGAPVARRDDREYREYLSEEQRSQRGCIAGRMQADFHHGLPGLIRHLTVQAAKPAARRSINRQWKERFTRLRMRRSTPPTIVQIASHRAKHTASCRRRS